MDFIARPNLAWSTTGLSTSGSPCHRRRPGLPSSDQADLTVNDLILAFIRHCEQYYVKSGEATNPIRMIRLTLTVVNRVYRYSAVRDFGSGPEGVPG